MASQTTQTTPICPINDRSGASPASLPAGTQANAPAPLPAYTTMRMYPITAHAPHTAPTSSNSVAGLSTHPHPSTGPLLTSLYTSIPAPPPLVPKRRQVKTACKSCQKACKKCDDARPCLRCIRYSLPDCQDAPRKARAGGKRGSYKKREKRVPAHYSKVTPTDNAAPQNPPPMPPPAPMSYWTAPHYAMSQSSIPLYLTVQNGAATTVAPGQMSMQISPEHHGQTMNISTFMYPTYVMQPPTSGYQHIESAPQ